MKKLLSICFLSILLGLLSFSVSAQVGPGQNNCKSGFWVENLQPDVVTGVVNLGLPAPGELQLKHTLGSAVFNPTTGAYVGNAQVGRTELYELHFCNTCGLDPKTKVSVDWLVIRDGDTINDNLSEYLDLSIYTFYNNLNVYGECQSVSWLGGKVNDGFGYCEPQQGMGTGIALLDTIYGVNAPCRDPQNYPGAMQVAQGTPNSVLTQLGMVAPAQGLVNIYSQALDYFYLDFFEQTRNIVVVNWKRVGDYKLVMRIRQRTGGTAWNNMTWNANETTDFVGGHQSCCGPVIAEDIIGQPYYGETAKEICNFDDAYIFGRPSYSFHTTMPDTNVVFGDTICKNVDGCEYFQVDSLFKFHFTVHHNPVVAVKDTTLCKCNVVNILDLVTVDQEDYEEGETTIALQWWYDRKWNTTLRYNTKTKATNGDSVYTYRVRQINTYHDTLDCEGPAANFTVTFKEMLAPVVTPTVVDFCREAIDANTLIKANVQLQDDCGTKVRWYSKLNGDDGSLNYQWLLPPFNRRNVSDINTSSLIPNVDGNLQVNLNDFYTSTVNKDTVLYFFAVAYKEDQENCESPWFDYFTVTIHQTPELAKVTSPDSLNCPGAEVTMKVKINNNPDNTDTLYTYKWTNVNEMLINGARVTAPATVENTITGSSVPNYLYPVNPNFRNSYTQQIFTNEEVAAGKITKLAFQWKSNQRQFNKNIQIYLSTTDQSYFNTSTRAWFPQGVKVYDGPISCYQAGWYDLELQTPYEYDATQNLVVTVTMTDVRYESGLEFAGSSCNGNKAMSWRSDNNASYVNNPNSIPTNSRNYHSYRANIRFTVDGPIPATDEKNQEAYFAIPDTTHCGTTFATSVFVVDGNGCVSQPVEFNYGVGDTIAPVISGNHSRLTTINACDLDVNGNAAAYTTVADFKAGFSINRIQDNCTKFENLVLSHTDVYTPATDTTCEAMIVRTYKVTDYCGNFTTFTHTIIAHDQDAPIFRAPEDGGSPYIRMIPVRDTNCTYNAPSKEVFVRTILPVVYDSCTNMTYEWLYDHSEFYWENSEWAGFDSIKAPNTKNIFGTHTGNQLTVRVYVTDKCGNSANAMILYFNRPDSMYVQEPSLTISQDSICFGETVTLTLDSTQVKFDDEFELAHPLQFEWSARETEVTFATPNSFTTEVTPTAGDKIYHFRVKVTDALGCTAYSEYINLAVKSLPNVAIQKDVRNGAEEPYCPNYGVLTVEAVDAVTGNQIPNLTYKWSGESVNNLSTNDTSFISILPDRCRWTYTPVVEVEDIYFHCKATASLDVFVADTVGPEYFGEVIRDTVEREAECKMYVPDFIHYLNNANLIDNCYPFSTFTFRQVPAEGTEITELTPVTIYVTTPCDETEYAISNKFFACPPQDVIQVIASVDTNALCEPGTFHFSAAVQNNNGTMTWKWTRSDVNGIVSTTDNFEQTLNVKNNANETVYQYQVEGTDALGCHDIDLVSVTVYKAIIDLDTNIYANTHCDQPWSGTFVVNHAPRNWGYYLVSTETGERIIGSEVPGMDPNVPENTRIFDYLQDGDYQLFVTTDHGCVSGPHDVTILPNFPQVIVARDEVKAYDPTYCTNNNGYIVINNLSNSTYEVTNLSTGEIVPMPYTGLSVGQYMIRKTNVTTKCYKDTVVTINRSNASLNITVNATANTICGDELFNGTVTLPATPANLLFTVTNDQNNVIYTGNAATIDSLAEGVYHVDAIDTVTGCTAVADPEVLNGRQNPSFNVTAVNNNYCENEFNTYNGSLSMSNVALTYVVENTDTGDTTGVNGLAAGHYKITGTDSKNCYTVKYKDIDNVIVVPTYTVSAGDNTSCDPDVLAYNGSVKINITNSNSQFDNYIKDYTIVFEDSAYTNISSKTKIFNNLPADVYEFEIISKYYCSVESEIEVEQFEYPELRMHATPNTMCVGTFEHPGNGTIVMDSVTTIDGHVYYRDQNFEYSFFYATYNASKDEYEAGDQLLIPYWVPISYTLFNLPDSLYFVSVYDRITGCTLTDTITVPLGRDHLVITAETEGNINCIAPFTGTVTVDATPYRLNTQSINVDAVLRYTLVSGDVTYPYQASPVFTGVKDGTYTLIVKDTTTGCEYPYDAQVVVEKIANDITITPTITPDHACQGGHHDGTLSVVATSTDFPNAQYVFKFQNETEYSATSSWTGLSSAIAYQVSVMDQVSGCVVDSTFNIPLNNVCAPQIQIIGGDKFCLNEENAQLCAVVTQDPECQPGRFHIYWTKDCHQTYVEGNCIDVATDLVHCCTYTVHVYDSVSGCESTASKYVCIVPINTIHFTINHQPYPANTFEYCTNDSVYVGIMKEKWVEAVWSNRYVTPDEKKPLDLEFLVAPYSNVPYTVQNNMFSYCVDAVDSNGCPARSVINLVPNAVPQSSIHDTLCAGDCKRFFSLKSFTWKSVCAEDGVAGQDGCINAIYRDTIPNASVNGCDSIAVHYITFLPMPVISGTVPTSVCAGTTVGQLVQGLQFEHAKDTVYMLNGNIVNRNDVLTYSQCANMNLSVSARSNRYNGDNYCVDSKTYSFVVNTVPSVGDLTLANAYCADGIEISVNKPSYSCNVCNQLGACSQQLYVLNADKTVFEDLSSNGITATSLKFTPRLRYDGKTLAFVVGNGCGYDTAFAALHVDSTVVRVNIDDFCEGDTINYASALGKNYSQVIAFVINRANNVTTPYTRGSQLPYSLNGYGLFFRITGEVCDPILTDTATLVIHPKPVVIVDDHETDLCLSEAASYINGLVDVQYADTTCWLYLVPSVQTIWQESFNSAIPNTWKTYKLGGNGWMHNTNGYLSSAQSSMSSSVTVDNWIFTPAINVEGGMRLDYDVRKTGANYNGNYKVYVLTADTVNSSATPVFEGSAPNGSFATRSIDLSSYNGQQVYVAFRHVGTGNVVAMQLDNVVLKQTSRLIPVKNVTALVDSIKNMPQADVYFYAGNDCETKTEFVGNFRILLPLQLTASSVTVCPNASLSDILDEATTARAITPNIGHYTQNEVELQYYVNGQRINDDYVLPSNFVTGSSITVKLTTKDNVKNCGDATASLVVNLLTNTHTEATFQEACRGNALSSFVVTTPQWTGTATIAQPSAQVPVTQGWQINTGGNVWLNVNTDQIITADTTVRYRWYTTCGQDIFTEPFRLTVNDVPDVTVNDYIEVCEGTSITEAETGLTVTYHGNEGKYDTVWTLNNVAFAFDRPLTYADSGKMLIATITPIQGQVTCGPAADTLELRVNPLPVVEVNGPSKVCSGTTVTFTATPGFQSYTFSINGEALSPQTGNTYTFFAETQNDEPTTFFNVSVVATDDNNCVSAVAGEALLRVSTNAEFYFYDSVTTQSIAGEPIVANNPLFIPDHETHEYTATTGTGLQYSWMVNKECYNSDRLVFVEYDFFFKAEGEDEFYKIPNNERSLYFVPTIQTNAIGNIYSWISSNQFYWRNADNSTNGNISYMDYTVANPNVSSEGNHFPNHTLGLATDNIYDDLWMHFLEGRPVVTTVTPFRRAGEYKVEYRLYATSHEVDFEHLYTEDNIEHDNYGSNNQHIGGQNALVGNAVLTLLAMDSIKVTVTGEDIPVTPAPSGDNYAPQVAPSLVVDETVAPDLEVWPNPAPATETTLKARVHNLSGNAQVTLTSLTGKQVYTGETYIDNDNYYFEFNVNNLAVGSYILTVRTNEAVITKKVVVTVLAR